MATKPEKKPRTRTREVRRVVTISENRCHQCGEWFETARPTTALYCPPPKLCRVHAFRAARK